MVKNLLTLDNITESVAKVIAPQQSSTDSLAKVVLDNRIDLGYLLPVQGGVCAVVNTTGCTRSNIFGEVKVQIYNT